jgi:hypothetical protein
MLGSERPRVVDTHWISQFETPLLEKGCWLAAKQMTEESLADGRRPPRLVGGVDAGKIKMSRDSGYHGRVRPLPDSAAGREYIDRMLDAGLRVMAGVTYWDEEGRPMQDDLGTRHFITIYGRGYEAVETDRFFPDSTGRSRRVYYLFADPAPYRKSPDDFFWAKLFWDDATGVLFKPGSRQETGSGYVGLRDYSVTHVRVYEGTR